jgi:hypothetical protein
MKAAVVYLTQRKNMSKLRHSLRLTQKHLLDSFSYPVIIFHEGDFAPYHQQQLTRICPTLEFRLVDIKKPASVDVTRKSTWAMIKHFGVGYRNMCRFFTVGLYPYLEGLDYYMRLDDDSFIESKFRYDPFLFMETTGVQYAWRSRVAESPAAIGGLKKCLVNHDQRFRGCRLDNVIYTNFHMARVDMWSKSPIKEAIEHIDKHGGIYTKRWGDAPIHTALVDTFLPPDQRHRFKDFRYKHGRRSWAVGK